jgi:putative membrane protein
MNPGNQKQLVLSDPDASRIAAAVRQGELTCGAEISVVVTDEAADYPSIPLAWATGVVLVAPYLPLVILAVVMTVSAFIDGWGGNPEYETGAKMLAVAQFATWQLGLFILIAAIASIPPVRRALTPDWVKRSAIRRQALEQFIARGLTHTRERTGLLIYLSCKDRMADVIADVGISSRMSADDWRPVVDTLNASLKKKHAMVEVVLTAIEACSRLIEKKAPGLRATENETPDAPVVAPHSIGAMERMLR